MELEFTLQDWIVPNTKKRPRVPNVDVDRPTKRRCQRTCLKTIPLLQLPQGLAITVLHTSNTFEMWRRWLQTSRHYAAIARLRPVVHNTIFPLTPSVLTAIRTKELDPRLVSHLSFLRRYNCPPHELGYIEIRHLAPFTSLSSLHMELFEAGEDDMSPIGDLRSLTKLSLQGPGYFDTDNIPYLDFTWMHRLIHLRSLDLMNIPHGSDLESITFLPVLTELRLYRTEWCPDMWDSLTQITKLSLTCVLKSGEPTNNNLAALASLTHLNELHLQDLGVTHLDILAHLPDLQKLTLVQMTSLTSIAGVAHCPALTSLQVDDCSAIDMDITQLPLSLERIILCEVFVRDLHLFAPLPHLKVLLIFTFDSLFSSQPQLQSPHMVEYMSQVIPTYTM